MIGVHQPQNRVSVVFCVQPVYTTGNPCIRTVDTHAPAACLSQRSLPTQLLSFVQMHKLRLSFLACDELTLEVAGYQVVQKSYCPHAARVYHVESSLRVRPKISTLSPDFNRI